MEQLQANFSEGPGSALSRPAGADRVGLAVITRGRAAQAVEPSAGDVGFDLGAGVLGGNGRNRRPLRPPNDLGVVAHLNVGMVGNERLGTVDRVGGTAHLEDFPTARTWSRQRSAGSVVRP